VQSVAEYVASIGASPLAPWANLRPEQLTAQSASIVEQLLSSLSASEYHISSGVAVHATATVEQGATLKPPLVLSRGAFVAAGAYLRGGCWLGEGCCVGPSSELKSSFVFAGSVLAHFNFVGDSIIGSQVNFEAGSVICNHRNEHRVASAPAAAVKFGALVGDGSRIGANAVLAPGTFLAPHSVVGRLELVDQQRS
jgi:UDP-N-acetylglucosamine diphosphorylase / glucose-1-phosphate thymidylyltransferase / UDP-N-acetylgalactosamine diphosphorylase / glucosamine-1-phosphate N-acetyltransferase / galactosamine-1-phosphate N-acetyltransferase